MPSKLTPQKEARDNAAIEAIKNHLAQKQDAFFQLHGRYFQLLRSPSVKADHDDEKVHEKVTPPGEKFAEDVPEVQIGNLPFQLEVHVYSGGGEEPGYEFVLFREFDSLPHFRRIDPKKKTDTDWQPINEI